MTNSSKILDRLVRSLCSNIEPSTLFIESLSKYLIPQHSSTPKIDQLLNERSEKAFLIYKKLPFNENTAKIVYVFLCLSNKKPNINDELRIHLKQGALGFETSYFNSAAISSLRSKINNAIFNIVYVVYSNGLIYRQLKIEQENPLSLSHRYFLKRIIPFLKEYEQTVVDSASDFLDFYSNLYIHFKKIKKLGILNDSFRNRLNLKAYSNLNVNFENTALKTIDPVFVGFEDVIHQIYNECTISYLLTGSFDDPFSEYFIKNHVLDYGLIPLFISKHIAEMIAYIGKYTAFLKSIGALSIPYETQNTIGIIDLAKNSASNHLKDALVSINTQLYTSFFVNYKILELLEYIHSTFLFGRMDFIEKLFVSLKESRKTGRKNICNVLENSLKSSFPMSPFNSLVDIYITQDEPLNEKNESLESFSLYIKLDYPVSLLIEEEFVIKLVYIFKFLWKLKKIDHLSRRLRQLKYYNFIQKFQFYVFNEVIGAFSFEFPDFESFGFDIFKKNINKRLDDIMRRLFINTRAKKTENMLFYLEKYLLGLGTNNMSVDEGVVIQALREFTELSKNELAGTYLFNIQELF